MRFLHEIRKRATFRPTEQTSKFNAGEKALDREEGQLTSTKLDRRARKDAYGSNAE